MWQYYLRLDAIWMREFADLESARDATRMFPLLLYFNAHAKMRVAMELAFSGCMGEARSILRDAIEFVAHAHTMISDPKLQKTWLSKNDGNVALEEFKNAFERQKKVRVFQRPRRVDKTWGELSETGSHANINALVDRFVQLTADDHIQFRLNYTGPVRQVQRAIAADVDKTLQSRTAERNLSATSGDNLQAIRITRGPFGGHLFSRASSCNQKKQRTQKREPSAPEGGGKPAAAFGRPFPHSQGGVHYPFP
jgi:hypothetical protein